MSVPGTESAGAAERAAGAAPPAPGTAVPGDNPRLPRQGSRGPPTSSAGLASCSAACPTLALLPLQVSLIGTHPVVAELLNGSTEPIISAAAFARTEQGR